MLISSLLFINSVVAPVAEVTDAAKRISGGSYGIQLPNPYTDEMGELVDNINDMSLKISQSEKIQTEFISSVDVYKRQGFILGDPCSIKQVLDEHLFLQRRFRCKVFALIRSRKAPSWK